MMHQRWSALDRLRGVALAGMLIHHLTKWMTGDARAVLPGWRSFSLTDVPAIAFFVAAGASLALFVSSRRARGLARGRVAAQVLRRYGLLVPIGLALDWVLWRHPTMFGVLEALGVAVVAAAAVAAVIPERMLPAAAAITLAGGVVAERLATARRAGGPTSCWPASSRSSPTSASCWWARPPCARAATRTAAGP